MPLDGTLIFTVRTLGDTIVACITGGQQAPVAIVRLSGPESLAVALRVFAGWETEVTSHKMQYGRFITGDDGLAVAFLNGHSYTGEDTVELHTHGSLASVRLLLEACVKAGARVAEPGEFTYRAFMNGKVDLTQAEAVREIIEAETSTQLRAASELRTGKLAETLETVQVALLAEIAAIEASVDFSEEIGEYDRLAGAENLKAAVSTLDDLIDLAKRTRWIREGVRIALVGRPNVGKSSLMNAILGHNRSIVSPHSGTTRDFIEAVAEIEGLKVTFIDTAGLRETSDPIETEGVRRSHEVLEAADWVLFLFDASAGWGPDDARLLPPMAHMTLVANKSDLGNADRGVPVSALTGKGIPQLISAIKEGLCLADLPAFPVLPRHTPVLEEARQHAAFALEGLGLDVPDDLIVTGLRQAMIAVGQITGEAVDDTILDRIFGGFCIGK